MVHEIQTPTRWRRTAACGLAAVTAALVAACGNAGGNAAGPASGQTGGNTNAGKAGIITAHQLTGIGTVLADRSGKTIYSPEQEASGMIRCTGSCLSFWFPVTVSSAPIPRHASGLAGVLGTVHRPDDGKTQLTYDGKPLYTFRLDQSPGQVHGNDFTDSFGGTSFTWLAVTASGTPGGSGQAGTSPSAGPYTGSGSGY